MLGTCADVDTGLLSGLVVGDCNAIASLVAVSFVVSLATSSGLDGVVGLPPSAV